ncbi:MAG: hypothetical protein WCJ30_00770 [Deltaproteobacteria bacterium]
MLIQCERCGAPLEVPPGQSIVKCAFCHSSTQLKSKTAQQPAAPMWPAPTPTPAWPPPGGLRPGFPQAAPLNAAAAQFARAQARRAVVSALGGMIALVAVAVAVFVRGGGSIIGGLNVTAAPTLGLFDVGPAFPVHFERTGTAGGSVDASRLGTSCRGHFPRAAHLLLHLRQPAVLSITTANTSTDLTIAVRGPDGSIRCDDDGGQGNNPLVHGQFGAGDFRVWIGTYSSSNSSSEGFSLGVDVQATGTSVLVNGLVPDAPPTLGVIDTDQSPGGTQAMGMATGTVDGSHVAPSCRGWYSAAPTALVRLSAPRFVSLTTEGNDDLTMLVRTPSGMIFCDDDGGYGSNPLVAQVLQPGVYAVWVGPFSQGRTLPYTLSVIAETLSAAGPSALGLQSPPTLGVYSVAGGAPQSYRGIAVHHVAGSTVDPRCGVGFLSAPHLALMSDGPRRVMISADGTQRLNFAVRTPDGTVRCVADRPSEHPSALVDVPAGASLLWVGTSDSERHVPFTLTLQPLVPAGPAARPARGTRVMRGGPSGGTLN